MQPSKFIPSSRARRAFSLIELLTAVSIMTVIIIALYAMFDHTQKALRGSVSQTDVLESGRAAMELIKRDLEQMSAARGAGVPNFYAQLNTNTAPFYQSLPGDASFPNPQRTNRLHDFLFLTKFNNNWTASGYKVFPIQSGSPVGSLGRFTTNTVASAVPFRIMAKLINRDSSEVINYQPVIDGVVSLTILPYDRNGNLMVATNSPLTYRYFANGTYYFLSNSLPPYVEVELGILEPYVVNQYKAMSGSVAANFLARQAGKVHLFRERIPIRTASR
ncbi:MAG: prepilin-type N-terminal cleavage/methylation domain-containing protein [Verrucomicrobia bacterium]|nr:prepilin-type N-terminal cleavage/methylation domain-containing protein [Verrucomicrobiota bacterium]